MAPPWPWPFDLTAGLVEISIEQRGLQRIARAEPYRSLNNNYQYYFGGSALLGPPRPCIRRPSEKCFGPPENPLLYTLLEEKLSCIQLKKFRAVRRTADDAHRNGVIHIDICTDMYFCLWAHIFVYIHICTITHAYKHTYMHTCIHT